MPKTIMKLGRKDCRYILAGGLYCAEPSTGQSSFCAEHQKLCYVQSSRTRARLPIALPIDTLVSKELPMEVILDVLQAMQEDEEDEQLRSERPEQSEERVSGGTGDSVRQVQ